MMRRARPSGGLENEVMACLAAADEALTPAEVRAELGGDLAYTTVMTTLARLHAKQALTRTKSGRAFAYQLVGGEQQARARVSAHQMQKVLDAGEDRLSILSRFVDGLDPRDETALRELLRVDEQTDHPPPKRPRRGT